MKKRIIKKYFTLLEVIISIAIIALIMSSISFKMHEKLTSYKYESNFKKINSYFDLCKKISFTNQSDIYLYLSQNKEDIFLEIGTDEESSLFKNRQKIKDSFKNMSFRVNKEEKNKLEILFSSTNYITPKTKIEFFDKKQKFKYTIDLLDRK